MPLFYSLRKKNIKGLIRSRKSKNDEKSNDQKFEDTKEAIRSRKSKKNRQHNG